MDRRRFIHHGACIAGLAAFSPGISAAESAEEILSRYPGSYLSPEDLAGPDPLPQTGIYPPMPNAVVSVAGVRGSVEKAVREVVEAAGGLEEIQPGQRVMIKPNMNGPFTRALRCTTNPRVLRAVIRLVKERGAHVMVGDRSAKMTELSFRITGFANVCRREKAEAFPWNRSEYVWFHPNKRHWSKGFRIPKILTEVDHWINVPILKNHESTNAEYTCCLKSFVGVCYPDDRMGTGTDTFHVRNISEKIAELNLCAAPLMNIVDATRIMIKGGPGDGIIQGDPFYRIAMWDRPNLIFASRDRVACDSVAFAALKLYGAENKVERPYVTRSVWDQVQIYYAAELGIGQAEPEMITIEDIKVPRFDEIKANWI